MTNLNIILNILDWLKIGGFFLLNENTEGIEWIRIVVFWLNYLTFFSQLI